VIVSVTVMMLIILGGIGFYVFMEVLRERRFKNFSLHTKLVLIITFALIISGALLVLIMEYSNPATLGALSLRDKIMASFFQSVTPRTAGFNTIDTAGLGYAASLLVIIFMFVGGSPGSTAGGIKTTTTGIILISTYRLIMGYEDIEVLKRRIDSKTTIRALSVATISILLVSIVTIILSLTEINSGFTFHDILFEVTSAFGTVGLSRGLTPNLSNLGRILITLTMFVGRIGPLTIAFAIAQGQDKVKGNYRYPVGKILVG
ncbi:MAG: potassium transporter TrkG, partial [Eubacteriales bacterium]